MAGWEGAVGLGAAVEGGELSDRDRVSCKGCSGGAGDAEQEVMGEHGGAGERGAEVGEGEDGCALRRGIYSALPKRTRRAVREASRRAQLFRLADVLARKEAPAYVDVVYNVMIGRGRARLQPPIEMHKRISCANHIAAARRRRGGCAWKRRHGVGR